MEGREWVEAGRVARKSKRADLLPTTVITALSEAHVAMEQEVHEFTQTVAPTDTTRTLLRASTLNPKP